MMTASAMIQYQAWYCVSFFIGGRLWRPGDFIAEGLRAAGDKRLSGERVAGDQRHSPGSSNPLRSLTKRSAISPTPSPKAKTTPRIRASQPPNPSSTSPIATHIRPTATNAAIVTAAAIATAIQLRRFIAIIAAATAPRLGAD